MASDVEAAWPPVNVRALAGLSGSPMVEAVAADPACSPVYPRAFSGLSGSPMIDRAAEEARSAERPAATPCPGSLAASPTFEAPTSAEGLRAAEGPGVASDA